jgi:prophage antirepressor-like protein
MATPDFSTTRSQLVPFQFGAQQIRVAIQGDDPWFIASDVCAALDIGNHRQALTRLDDDEKGVISNDTLGGRQEMLIISEPGLYSLILTSRKDEAKAFKRWIVHEVIPSIRKTGSYTLKARPKYVDPIILQHRTAVQVAASYLEMGKLFGTDIPMARAIAADAVQQQTGVNVQPLLAGNVVEDPPMTATELGKCIGISARKINALLALQGFQERSDESGDWVPTEQGKAHATCHPYKSQHSHHCGYKTLWHRTVLDVLDMGTTHEGTDGMVENATDVEG